MMSAEILLVLLAAWTPPDEEPVISDLEFIEYLGSWQGSDRDWLLMDGLEKARDEAEPAGAEVEPIEAEKPEESREDEDDS